jgi:uncharacterized protein YbjT (DUF2867 family)
MILMILVTGATGRVGSKLVESLVKSGAQVKGLVRNPQKAATLHELGVSVIFGDLDQSDCLDIALQGCDRLLSIPPNTINQAEQEIELFKRAKQAGVRQIVKLSTIKANLESSCHFFQQHAIAEEYLRRSSIRFTILQSNSFMQNFLWFTQEIRQQRTLSLPMGEAKIAPVDIRDLVSVASVILLEEGHGGRTYNLTGLERLSLQEIATIFSSALRQKILYHDTSPLDFQQILHQAGVPRWYAEAVVASWQIASREQPTLTDIVTEIGGKQPIPFETFVRDYFGIN